MCVFEACFQRRRHVTVSQLPAARCHDDADDVIAHDVTAADLRPGSASPV